MEPLTYAQKALNQRLLAAHTLSEHDLDALWTHLSQGDEEMSLLDALKSANAQLALAGLEIAAVAIKQPEGPPIKYFSMINKIPDELAKETFGKQWSVAEHALVRKWIAELAQEKAISKATLLNMKADISAKNLNITLNDADSLLSTLLEECWLEVDKGDGNQMKGQVQLAPRAYLELSAVLTEEFGMEDERMPQQFKFLP